MDRSWAEDFKNAAQAGRIHPVNRIWQLADECALPVW
jgi:hypothetical protein